MKVLKWIGISLLLAFLFIFVKDIIHVFASAKYASVMAQSQSRAKNLGTATMLYRTDNDGRYPHSSAMPGFRAQILGYVKSKEAFEPVNNDCTEPTFNFNLAGVATWDTHAPPGSTFFLEPNEVINPEQVIEIYSLNTIRNEAPFFAVHHADESTKNYYKDRHPFFFQYLGTQFGRPGFTLASADYLADQDPLRK